MRDKENSLTPLWVFLQMHNCILLFIALGLNGCDNPKNQLSANHSIHNEIAVDSLHLPMLQEVLAEVPH